MYFKYPRQGFTLVELIVVITIVGILSTVGFVSYSGYLTGARDSNRVSQLTKISDSLQVYSTNKSLPFPDNSVEITASGTLIAYQGEVGVDVLETIDFTNGGTDPKDGSYFSYYLTKDRNSLQLMSMMEEQASLVQKQNMLTLRGSINNITYAVDYESRYPKVYGSKLGIFTYNDISNPSQINTPLEKISGITGLDIVNTPINYTAHVTDVVSEKISGNGASLRKLRFDSSCSRIRQVGISEGNGIYVLNASQDDEREVYCYMDKPLDNEMIINWTVGQGVVGGFNINGDITENVRQVERNPFGEKDIVWVAIPGAVSNGDGGWNYDHSPIDSTKTYRISIWIKKTGSTDGTTYLGTSGVNRLDGNEDNNPYFWSGDLPDLNQWYLIVGYIHPEGYVGTERLGQIYNVSGDIISATGRDFKWRLGQTTTRHRSYLYYSTTTTDRQYFYDPQFVQIDTEDVGYVDDLLRK